MTRRGIFTRLILATTLGLFLGNTSLFERDVTAHQTRLIAHRGVHHVYAGVHRSAQTCRAAHVEPITHSLIENTIPSMRAAFEAGADVVEIDVHLTSDKAFAVFHDWTLDCQTDGSGITRKTSIDVLKKLDLGHKITADGQTFPLRGHGVGLMPDLRDVVGAELPGQVLINVKSDDQAEGLTLARRLDQPALRAAVFGVYGGARPTRAVMHAKPDVKGLHKPGLIQCLSRYALHGWSGYVPNACRNALVAVPANIAPFLWGWPHRFTRRMTAVGSDVILWGPYDGSGFSSGIDTPDALKSVPENFDGYVWTNKIEIIGPLLRTQRNP